MSDAAAISQYTRANLAADVSMKVAVKTKDIAKQRGAAVLSLLDTAAKLSKTLSHDPAKGTHLDTLA